MRCEIGHVPCRSGSPHGVFGCFHAVAAPAHTGSIDATTTATRDNLRTLMIRSCVSISEEIDIRISGFRTSVR